MQTFIYKRNQPDQRTLFNVIRSNIGDPVAATHKTHPILKLQRVVGNKALQRLLQAQPDGLKIGVASAAISGLAHDSSQTHMELGSPAKVQTKSTLNNQEDSYEHEADRVAGQVMRMSEPAIQSQIELGEKREEAEEVIQSREATVRGAMPAQRSGFYPPIVDEVLHSGGQPLEPETRFLMEHRFGHDFSQVRIHTDERAAKSADAVDALAYTAGRHIIFGTGQYAPQNSAGQHLLAHELTHVLQPNYSQIRFQKNPRVKISKPIISTDMEQARRKGLELAELIKAGKWTPENDEQLAHWLEFFEDKAWYAFVFEIKDVLGQQINEYEANPKEHTDIFATSTEASLIVPTSAARTARGGFKVTYFAQIVEETSQSTSVEVYNDYSVSGGISLEIPIKKVVKIKIGAEARKGKRTAEKTEERKADRSGRTISRSFTVQKLEREVMNYQYIKTYHAPAPIAEKVTHEKTGANPREIQVGYQIIPDEGGKAWGPFWNVYSGYVPVQGSALSQVWEIIEAQQQTVAEDLVFGKS